MAFDGMGTGDFNQRLATAQRVGIQLPARPRVRDVEDYFMAIIEMVHASPDYVVKVQQLWLLYGTAKAYVTDRVKNLIDAVFRDPEVHMPSFQTEVIKSGMEGPMLGTKISWAKDSRSFLPLDSAAHFTILMEKQFLIAHYMIFSRLVSIMGDVVKDLEDNSIIPRKPETELAKVDLELEQPSGPR